MNKANLRKEKETEMKKEEEMNKEELNESKDLFQLEKSIIQSELKRKKYVPVTERKTLNIFGVDNRKEEPESSQSVQFTRKTETTVIRSNLDWDGILKKGQVKYEPSAFDPLTLTEFDLDYKTKKVKGSLNPNLLSMGPGSSFLNKDAISASPNTNDFIKFDPNTSRSGVYEVEEDQKEQKGGFFGFLHCCFR